MCLCSQCKSKVKAAVQNFSLHLQLRSLDSSCKANKPYLLSQHRSRLASCKVCLHSSVIKLQHQIVFVEGLERGLELFS